LPKESYLYRVDKYDRCYNLLIPKDFFYKPMYILGNIFLHNYYVIYDLDKNRIGLAAAK